MLYTFLLHPISARMSALSASALGRRSLSAQCRLNLNHSKREEFHHYLRHGRGMELPAYMIKESDVC
jgi:hypothetical protein